MGVLKASERNPVIYCPLFPDIFDYLVRICWQTLLTGVSRTLYIDGQVDISACIPVNFMLLILMLLFWETPYNP